MSILCESGDVIIKWASSLSMNKSIVLADLSTMIYKSYWSMEDGHLIDFENIVDIYIVEDGKKMMPLINMSC